VFVGMVTPSGVRKRLKLGSVPVYVLDREIG
jgi:hypothetical protein